MHHSPPQHCITAHPSTASRPTPALHHGPPTTAHLLPFFLIHLNFESTTQHIIILFGGEFLLFFSNCAPRQGRQQRLATFTFWVWTWENCRDGRRGRRNTRRLIDANSLGAVAREVPKLLALKTLHVGAVGVGMLRRTTRVARECRVTHQIFFSKKKHNDNFP